ncbi:MAG: hypothetical protein QNJ44_11960 [Rhodobacter sp.]|nr:hypothetical protein [Rhodobacter sp.]
MSGTQVTIGTRRFEVVPDITGRDRVFVAGAVTDDADGRSIARSVALTSSEPMAFAARSDSEIAVAGNPNVLFADRTVAHSVTVTLEAPGYRLLQQSVVLPAFAALPVRQDFALRRLPVTITGRIFGRTVGPTPSFEPLPDATVALSPVPADGGELPLLLRQPLRADPGAGATLRRRAVAAQPALTVIEDAAAGQNSVVVADPLGSAPGDLLRIGAAHRGVYAEIRDIAAHPDRPAPAALVRMTEALVAPVRADATLDRFTPGGFSGPTGNLVGTAFAGEAVVWLDTLPASGGVLVLREAGLPDRYHDAHVPTGPGGDYRIDGLARIGTPVFEVSAPGFTTATNPYNAARLGAGPLDWYLVP